MGITGIKGEWVRLSAEYINTELLAYVEDAGPFLILHFIKDRADRQRIPIRGETKPWIRRTLRLFLHGADAEIMRAWLNKRGVMLVLPKEKRTDPDEF